eukprot:TRINITY_DN15017_c0_g1_i1.p1 TRINITY_DN15017_c0_g1~~TRINITY_DN15017_c0_g1_i1.p1  ORF type:complete len:250 (-),score=40.55 TRINITY_DN15017_c0_g1_i1:44-793(-)
MRRRSFVLVSPFLRRSALYKQVPLRANSFKCYSSALEHHGTTILCVKNKGKTVIVGDGQVSLGSQVVKPNARKVRRFSERPNIICGFAGATADAFTLIERLEEKLEKHQGQVLQSCVELAKNWRMDKYLRRLEAMLIVADENNAYTLTGNGDVIEPAGGVFAIGSGGNFAQSAALALLDAVPDMDAEEIARRSMKIAGDFCIYTNHNLILEVVPQSDVKGEKEDKSKSKEKEEEDNTGKAKPSDKSWKV